MARRIADISGQTIKQVIVAVLAAAILALGALVIALLSSSSESGHGARQRSGTTTAVAGTSPTTTNAATPPVTTTGQSPREAYAITFAVIGRGVEDMLHCHEKLMPYATGRGTRVSFEDLKLLSTTMTAKQLAAVQEASYELDRLFPPGYSAPPSGAGRDHL